MVSFRKLGRFGRFGNQLFQYAGTRLYAELNGFKHAMPHWIGCDVFEDIKPCTFGQKTKTLALPTMQLEDVKSYGMVEKIKFLLGFTPHITWTLLRTNPPKLSKLCAGRANELPHTHNLRDLYFNPCDNINFYSYFQDNFSLELLQTHKGKVRGWFTFKKEIDNAYKKTATNLESYVGLHIRWGDLVKRGINFSLESYLEVLDKVRNKRPVYIATDSPELINRLVHLKPIQIKNPLPAIPDYIFDFWMLKNAETIIGGGSTFSWWAAYLGSGEYYGPSLTHLWSGLDKIEFSKQKV